MSYRCAPLCSRVISHHCPNPRRHCSCRHTFCPLPRFIDSPHIFRWRYTRHPRSIHRNVPLSRTGIHNLHAGRREAQRHIHRSRRHLSIPLHSRAHRRLLHGRVRQASTFLRPVRREPQAPLISRLAPSSAHYLHPASTSSSRCSNTRPRIQIKMLPDHKATISTPTTTQATLAPPSRRKTIPTLLPTWKMEAFTGRQGNTVQEEDHTVRARRHRNRMINLPAWLRDACMLMRL
jgi:hypothetical protein